MPLGGGSGEGGLAARGYNGPAQPGGNYGGTNLSGTGGGFLGDRSAINAAATGNAINPNLNVFSKVVDPITGKVTKVYTIKNGRKVTSNVVPASPAPPYNTMGLPPYDPEYGFFDPGTPSKMQDRIPADYSDYGGPVPGSWGMTERDWGGIGGSMGSDPNYPGGWSGSGKDQSQVPSAKDPSRLQGASLDSGTQMAGLMSMVAPGGPEMPLVSPGPMGPGGQPMGGDRNRHLALLLQNLMARRQHPQFRHRQRPQRPQEPQRQFRETPPHMPRRREDMSRLGARPGR